MAIQQGPITNGDGEGPGSLISTASLSRTHGASDAVGSAARQIRSARSFLLDGALVARADLKADLKADALIVLATHMEPGAPAGVGKRLTSELRFMAGWLGLSDVMAGADMNGKRAPKRTTVESGSAHG